MKTKYLAFAVSLALLASCSSDDDSGPQGNLKDTPITVTTDVAELSTRAIRDNALVGEKATLGLYVSHEQEKYNADHELYTYNSSSEMWGFAITGGKDNNQMFFNGKSFDWIAYSPYSITVGETTRNLYDATTFSVPTDGNYGGGPEGSTYNDAQTVDGSQYDLLWGKGTSTSATLNVALSHVLTKLTVNITALSSEIADGTTISSIKIGGSIPTGTLNLTEATPAAGVVTIPAENSAAVADITALKLATANNIPGSDKKYVASYEALIIPQTTALKLTVKLSDNREFTKTLSNQAFVSGKHYIIALQVGHDKVEINIVNVWDSQDISGGVAEQDELNSSEVAIAKFQHYFCDSNGNMAICPLDEYSHIWAVGAKSGETACQIFSDITGLSVTAKESYTYSYESEDGRVELRITGNSTADENGVYATLYVTIPGYEDIDQIKIVTPEYLKQNNVDTVIIVII